MVSATGTHWEEAEPDYWNMNTDIRTTAIVVWALSRLEPDSELLPNAVRWLMAVRQEGYWETTQDTAWSLLGLVEYMRASGELRGRFQLHRLPQRPGVGQRRRVRGEHRREPASSRSRSPSCWPTRPTGWSSSASRPRPGRRGEGQLYYTAYLRYYLPADQVQALDRGIIVARQYSPVDDPRHVRRHAPRWAT